MFHTIYSRIFHPCYLLLLIPLLHFPPLQFCPYRIFHSRIFSAPRSGLYTRGLRTGAGAKSAIYVGEMRSTDRRQRWMSEAWYRRRCCLGIGHIGAGRAMGSRTTACGPHSVPWRRHRETDMARRTGPGTQAPTENTATPVTSHSIIHHLLISPSQSINQLG